MNEILKVNYEKEIPTVSARELYEALGAETRFNDWFPRMCEYGFEEEKDFYSKMSKTSESGGRPSVDYEITVDMSKQICMLQRTEKGKQCRQYFIDLEKAWNTPEQIMSRALKMADKTIESLKSDVSRMKPKEIFADAVSVSTHSILIGDLAKLISQNGKVIGQNNLFKWMFEKGYLIENGSRRMMPTQKSMEMKLFEIKERAINNPDGSVLLTRTTKVTGKGQQYFINKFLA